MIQQNSCKEELYESHSQGLRHLSTKTSQCQEKYLSPYKVKFHLVQFGDS